MAITLFKEKESPRVPEFSLQTIMAIIQKENPKTIYVSVAQMRRLSQVFTIAEWNEFRFDDERGWGFRYYGVDIIRKPEPKGVIDISECTVGLEGDKHDAD
jgi:hypothetical protein